MASPVSSAHEDVIDRLKKQIDPEVISEREKAVRERVRAQYERAQHRLGELIDDNSTLPVTIADIQVHGLKNTRNGFMQSVFASALAAENQDEYTLKTAMEKLQETTDKLHKFGIFHPTISMYLDQAPPNDSQRTPLSAVLTVQERSRFLLKTGTELGNHEGGGYLNATLRNVFGGAESLYASASTSTSTADVGARARSSYEATFATPIGANPDFTAEVGGFASARNNHYFASHEEGLKGGRAGLKFLSRHGAHEVGYSGVWRQITGLGEKASMTVRTDAGDSVKSSVSHTFTRDSRDNKLLATSGSYLRNITEIAGFGGLGGDVAFAKNELETHHAYPLPYGCSVSAGLRAGAMIPLPGSDSKPKNSRINDRFFAGGSTDIRGFRENGIGPRDGNDAVGGDMFYSGGVSLYAPLPRLGPSSPFRFQAFLNGGRLVALQDVTSSGTDVKSSVSGAIAEIANGAPTMAAGVGLVYAHPVARFELNFALPVVVRADEKARKGLQFGVGISFL